MATLFIVGFPGAASTALGDVAFRAQLSVGAGSQATAALGTSGRWYTVRLVTDTDCQFEIGDSVAADSDSLFLPAMAVEYFKLAGGQNIAVIEQQ